MFLFPSVSMEPDKFSVKSQIVYSEHGMITWRPNPPPLQIQPKINESPVSIMIKIYNFYLSKISILE